MERSLSSQRRTAVTPDSKSLRAWRNKKEPDPKNPREKQPGVSEEAKVRDHVDKLAKGEDPAAEKSKEARADHVDITEKIKKKFSRPEQLP